MGTDLIFELYRDKRTVFSFREIALLAKESDFNRLKQRIHYYVRSGKLLNIRRGLYSKAGYSNEELACKIYAPSYISLEYVLQKAGIIFQYSSQITNVSYLSRTINVNGISLRYRKIKNEILYNTSGILRNNEGINIAIPERAFLDTLYFDPSSYFDSLHTINKNILNDLLKAYRSKRLNDLVKKMI